MEFAYDFGSSEVKLEAMVEDQQEGSELVDSISLENTILMKTDPNEHDSDKDNEDSSNVEHKVDIQHFELDPGSDVEEEMLVTKCLHNPDSFCYVCGVFMYHATNRKARTQGSISIANRPSFRRKYSDYFGFEIRDQHEPWVPHYACKNCNSQLNRWDCGTGKGLPFGTPRIWSKPSNHFDDCYFCLTIITMGRKPNIYPDLPSSRAPDYSKVAPGRNRSKHLVDLPTESGDPNIPSGVKLEAVEQEGVSFEGLEPDQENPTLQCKQRPEKFCYICGSYMKTKSKHPMNDPKVWRLYMVYFEVDVDPPVHPWEPKFSCANCHSGLRAWRDQKSDGLPFGVPRMWSKPSSNHSMDCYFCVVPVHASRQLNFDIDIPSSRAPDYNRKAPGKVENLQAFDDFLSKDIKQRSDDSNQEEKSPFANCKRQPDEFCFICGHFIDNKHCSVTSPRLWAAYKEYFQLDVDIPTHPWEPKFTCNNCCRNLYGWYKGHKRYLKFAVPRRWQQPTDHATDCYFCLVDNGGSIRSWSYPDLPSSRAPVPISADHPKRECRVVVKEEDAA